MTDSVSSKLKPSAAKGMHDSMRDGAFWDKAGIGISAACMLHCTSLPLLVALSPTLMGSVLSDASFHQWLLLFVLPTALFAFGLSWVKHRRWFYLVPGAIGLALVILAVMIGHEGPLGEVGEKLLSFVGGIALIFGHLFNLNRAKSSR